MASTSRHGFGRHWKALLAVVTMFAGLLVTAAPANAATPQCTSWVVSYDEGYVPATASGETNCWMLRGNYSEGVWALQMSLVYCYGQYVGPNGPDSDFGGNTFQALKNVQKFHRIKDDGGYGPQTRSVIRF